MKIRITGVPEHFNLPWKLAIEENLFQNLNIELIWKDEPSGTGAICKALRNNEVDLAISLTEGIVLDIENGNPSTILDVYVKSPLIWGIHTAADRKETSIQEFTKPIFAISRFQSGSHLMAKLEAKARNKKIEDSQWKEIQNLNNAIESLTKHETDVFFWEKFMTSPFVENKQLKRIGEFPTPWPSFVVVARNDFASQFSKEIQIIFGVVQKKTKELQQNPELHKLVSNKFKISEANAKIWSQSIQWNIEPSKPDILQKIINNVKNTMG
jgi:sulfonate transport system substrate-binding protein